MIILQSLLLIISLLLLQMPAEALLLVKSVHALELVFGDLHQSLAEWVGVCHPCSCLCRSSSSAGIAFSLHLAEPVDWLLDEYRLGEMCNATFVRPSILLLNWKFYFSQSNSFNLARLTSTICMHFPEQAKIKFVCPYARMGTVYVFTWDKQWEHGYVCVCLSSKCIYQPCYPYINVDRH